MCVCVIVFVCEFVKKALLIETATSALVCPRGRGHTIDSFGRNISNLLLVCVFVCVCVCVCVCMCVRELVKMALFIETATSALVCWGGRGHPIASFGTSILFVRNGQCVYMRTWVA